MKPVVDGLRQAYSDRVEFLVYPELDKDPTASEFASLRGVTAVPTMAIVSSGGVELWRGVGFQDKSTLEAELGRALSTAASTDP